MGFFRALKEVFTAGQSTPSPPGRDRAQSTPPPAKSARRGEIEAERKITRLASDGRQGVAGEYYHRADIRKFVGRRRIAPVGNWGAGLRTPAYLVRDPRNRHDRNAVMVRLPHDGSTVLAGFLPREVAPRWQPLLRDLEGKGRIAECQASVYRSDDGFQVVLHLSDPEDALFVNDEPDGATFLPAERQCAVTGEKDRQDVLARFAQTLGNVWATLHPATVPSGKYAGQPTIEARIDGSPVGLLTAAQGERYAEVLTYGPVVACEARVFQGTNYLEVQLMLPRVD